MYAVFKLWETMTAGTSLVDKELKTGVSGWTYRWC